MNIEHKLIIFDNEREYLLKLHEELLNAKYKVTAIDDIFDLEKFLNKNQYLVLILGINRKTEEYFDLLRRIKSDYPYMEIIILAKRGDVKSAFSSLMLGACNYLTKSESIADFIPVIDMAFEKALKKLKKTPFPKWTAKGSTVEPLPELVGSHIKIKKTSELVRKIAPMNLCVFITGETGVGKELVAQTVHHYSTRADKPFIPFNCAAIPDTLLESELFGHEKGAFTDAISQKRGLFEEADGGTIFLDEIAESSPVFQAKLLRVIETGKFRRLGSNREIKIDVRVISATNKDIHAKVKNNHFRPDLYFRLSGINIHICPLRERKTDIAVLADYFLNISNLSNNIKKKFSQTTLRILMDYDWPGNVRQLKNCVEKLAVLSEGEIIKPSDIDAANCFPDLLINAVDMEEILQPNNVKEPEVEKPNAENESFKEDSKPARSANFNEAAAALLPIIAGKALLAGSVLPDFVEILMNYI